MPKKCTTTGLQKQTKNALQMCMSPHTELHNECGDCGVNECLKNNPSLITG